MLIEMNNHFISLAFAAALVSPLGVYAADQSDAPDPADLTRPNTFIWIQGGASNNETNETKSSSGIGKVTGGVAGQLGSNASYLGLLEQSFDNKGTANTRGRLFTTFDTGNSVLSKLGFSVDYIRHAKTKDSTTALGVIGKLETPYNWLTFFPNLAAVQFESTSGNNPQKSRGYQFNLFSSLYLNDKGLYAMVAPQYTSLKDITIKKMEVSLGAPLTADNATWWDIKTSYTRSAGKARVAGISSKGADLMLGVSHYF